MYFKLTHIIFFLLFLVYLSFFSFCSSTCNINTRSYFLLVLNCTLYTKYMEIKIESCVYFLNWVSQSFPKVRKYLGMRYGSTSQKLYPKLYVGYVHLDNQIQSIWICQVQELQVFLTFIIPLQIFYIYRQKTYNPFHIFNPLDIWELCAAFL